LLPLRPGATLLAVLASSACGAGLSDLDWPFVREVSFVPYPQAAEPGERVRTTVAFDVPDDRTRVVGVQVAPGLFYEFYEPGSCDDAVEVETSDEPTTPRMVLCLTLCVDTEAVRGEREIRIEAITGADQEVSARGFFVVLDRYRTGPGVCDG